MEEERKDALLYFEDVLSDEDKGENDLRTRVAWLYDLAFSFKELMDLSKNDWPFRNLIITTLNSAFHIRIGFPSKLRRKLMKCKGEGQELFENMLIKMEEFRVNAWEEQNALDIARYGESIMVRMDIAANSETDSMTKKYVNDAEKVDVYKLSEQKIQKNLKDEVGLDDSYANKAVVYEENEQLDDLEAATADVKSFEGPTVFILEPGKDFYASFEDKKETCSDVFEKQ